MIQSTFLAFLIALLATDTDEWLRLDEIYAKSIKSAATHGQRILFLGGDMDGLRPINKIFIYDFMDDHAWEVSDGRISSVYKMVAVAGEEGFLLVDYQNMRQTFLDPKGAFISSRSLEGFDGYNMGLTVAVGVPIDSNRILLTGLELPKTHQIHMVILDLNAESFKTVFKHTIEGFGAFWFPNRENWCLVFPDSGRVDLFDSQFRQLRPLIPAGDPQPIVTDPGVRKLLSNKGISPNARLLSPPISWIGDTCYFRKKVFSGGGNYNYLVGALQEEKLYWIEEGDLPLGEFKDTRLIFNCNSGEFHRQKR